MVRVLAPKPRIILFDNADRALDREGYNLVHTLLAQLKGKATLILVSDDQNICALAETIHYFDHGRLVEMPRPEANRRIQSYRELRI